MVLAYMIEDGLNMINRQEVGEGINSDYQVGDGLDNDHQVKVGKNHMVEMVQTVIFNWDMV